MLTLSKELYAFNEITLIHFILNEKEIATSLSPGMALLDFIRYQQHLMGTKIGCREGDCGACTVLVGELLDGELHYRSMTSCLMPMGNVAGKHIVTIEGINHKEGLNTVQQAMADEGATQCGFCTPGFVMSLAGFCLSNKEATEQNAIASVDGNICRCTGYKSIERAANKVASVMKDKKDEEATAFVARKKILPEYFSEIKQRISNIQTSPLTTDHSLLTIVGGGTDLYVQEHDEMTNASIQFVFGQSGLTNISKEGNICKVGASVTVTDLKESAIISEAFPSFQRYAKLVSSTPIRNMATVAGNIVNASPIGDFTIFFLALNAQLELKPSSNDGKVRSLPLREFYKGYKQLDKKTDEHIQQLWFEIPGRNSLFNFEKVSKRTHLDIASVNSAILLKISDGIIEEAGLSAGGVGPVPMYLQKTSGFFKGKTISREMILQAIEIAQSEISPISDARGTREYKSLLLGQLIKAHFLTFFPELEIK